MYFIIYKLHFNKAVNNNTKQTSPTLGELTFLIIQESLLLSHVGVICFLQDRI